MGFAAHWPKALERNSSILTMLLLDKRKKREKKRKEKEEKEKRNYLERRKLYVIYSK